MSETSQHVLSGGLLIVIGVLLALSAAFFYVHNHGQLPGAPTVHIALPAHPSE